MLAADQLGQVAGLLFGIAVAMDLVDAQIGVGTVGQADRGGGAGDFLHRHHMRQIAHTGTAIFLARRHPQHAQIAQLAPQIGGEGVDAVDLCRARGDLIGAEGCNRVAQRVDFLAKIEIHAIEVIGHFPVFLH